MHGEGWGFEGNGQTLRVLTTLEVRSSEYRGLNLTSATLRALLKYPWTYTDRPAGKEKFVYDCDKPILDRLGASVDHPTVECQLLNFSDDIAYAAHDFEDAIELGAVGDFAHNSLRRQYAERIHKYRIGKGKTSYSHDDILGALNRLATEMARLRPPNKEYVVDLDPYERRTASKQFQRWLINTLVCDVEVTGPPTPDAQVPWKGYRVRFASPANRLLVDVLRDLIKVVVIDSREMHSLETKGERLVEWLFETLVKDHDRLLPRNFSWWITTEGTAPDRAVCDYISGMTDRYLLQSFNRFFGPDWSFRDPV